MYIYTHTYYLLKPTCIFSVRNINMPKRSKSKKDKKKKSTRRKKHPVIDGDILENSIGSDVPICNFMKKPGLICLFLVGILCIVLFKGNNRGIVAYLKRHRSNAVLNQRFTVPFHYEEEKGLQDKDTTTLSDGCKTPYLFEIEENMDFGGNDIRGGGGVQTSSLGHCCQYCAHTAHCKAFTYIMATKYCWMKHSKPDDKGKLRKTAKVISGYLPKDIFLKKEDKLDEELKQIGINGHLLQSTTEVYQGTPRKNTAQFEGYTVFYGVYRSSHFQLVQDHLNREQRNYLIMLHAIEKRRNALKAINNLEISEKNRKNPLVVDVGANQGLFALFAAKMGADVVAVEPQVRLCRLINWSALQNGFKVGHEIVLYQSAILDKYERVNMRDANINEGAIGTIVRGASGNIQSHPISDIVPGNRSIAFLKIDVEGAELAAIRSAYKLFNKHLVDNVVVEFGPPSRWRRTLNMAPSVAIKVMTEMTNKYKFDIRLLDSQVYSHYTASRGICLGSNGCYKPISSLSNMNVLISAMTKCDCEAYLHFAHNTELKTQIDEGIGETFSWLRL